MKCHLQEETKYFGTLNQLVKKNEDQISSSLVNKLRNIEQCIVKKELLHGLDIVREIINEYPVITRLNTKSNMIEKKDLDTIHIGGLQIEKKIGKVFLNNRVVGLSTNEYSLLMILVEKPNEIIHRDKLHEILLRTDYDGLNRSIDNTISRLRKKLGDESISRLKIKSIRGKGYLFSSDNW